MSLQNELSMCHAITPARLDRFTPLIDPAWIKQALQATDTASLRRRRLPAELVIWLVIGLALFRNQPIWNIMRQLALDQGATPLAWLFDQFGHHWIQAAPAPEACFHGLRPLAVDGVVWATPDTPNNRQAYGSTPNQHRNSPWPQVRAICLMDTNTHLIRAASLSGMALGELTSARDLIAHVPDRPLTLFDRLYMPQPSCSTGSTPAVIDTGPCALNLTCTTRSSRPSPRETGGYCLRVDREVTRAKSSNPASFIQEKMPVSLTDWH